MEIDGEGTSRKLNISWPVQLIMIKFSFFKKKTGHDTSKSCDNAARKKNAMTTNSGWTLEGAGRAGESQTSRLSHGVAGSPTSVG